MIKKYETYKDSGLEWMREIPNSWEIIKLRYLCDITTGDKDTINQEDNGKYPFFVRSQDVKSINSYSFDGEAILTAGDGDICKIWHYINDKFDFHQRVYMLSNFSNIEGRFLYYFLKENFIHEVLKLSAKSTVDSLRRPMFLSFPVSLPKSLEVQTQIAKYLDYQTGLIDAIIEKKELLIQKLKAQRQAIINEAVTGKKVWNGTAWTEPVEVKDSGIEWLGEIPEHWVKRDLQTVVLNNQYSLTGGPFGSDLKNEEFTDSGVRIIQLQNIGVGEFRDDYKIYTTEKKADQLFSCNIFPGDIIIAKMADPVARACIMPNISSRYIMASDGIRLEVNKEKFNTKFLEYAINSSYFNQQANMNSTGTTRLRIGLTTLKKLKLVTPDLNEQNKIAEFLEIFNANYLSIINKSKDQIQKLKSYRQSIISEAVTGKIDVRDWQAPKSNNKIKEG